MSDGIRDGRHRRPAVRRPTSAPAQAVWNDAIEVAAREVANLIEAAPSESTTRALRVIERRIRENALATPCVSESQAFKLGEFVEILDGPNKGKLGEIASAGEGASSEVLLSETPVALSERLVMYVGRKTAMSLVAVAPCAVEESVKVEQRPNDAPQGFIKVAPEDYLVPCGAMREAQCADKAVAASLNENHFTEAQTLCAYCGEASGHTKRCSVTKHGAAECRMSAKGDTFKHLCTWCHKPVKGHPMMFCIDGQTAEDFKQAMARIKTLEDALRKIRRFFGKLEPEKSETGTSAWQVARDAFLVLNQKV